MRPRPTELRRFVLAHPVVLTLGTLYVAAAALLDRHGRREPSSGAFDAIVVLGCRVYADGTPSPSLERRVRRAVQLYHQRKAPRLVLTGGLGNAPVSEARAAARLAASLGVPKRALILEERSTTTEENAREAARSLEGSVLVVTDSYHVFRAERVFGRHFERAVGVGSVGPSRARLKGSMREVLAVLAYAARGRL